MLHRNLRGSPWDRSGVTMQWRPRAVSRRIRDGPVLTTLMAGLVPSSWKTALWHMPRRLPRRRYEATNPVVSVRIPKELYEVLVEFKDSKVLSMADALKIGLETSKPDLEAAWQ